MSPSRGRTAAAWCLCLWLLSAGLPSTVAESSHTVRPGDTLYDLAREFETTVEELKALNGLASSTIRVGQVLVLPGSLPRSGFGWHTVAAGESLLQLAEELGLSLATLGSANPTLPSGPLAVGTAVRIPPGEGRSIVVGEGDALLAIAAANGLSPSALVQVNGLSGLGDLESGQWLFLPVVEAEATSWVPTPAVPAVDTRSRHDAEQQDLFTALPLLLASYRPANQEFLAPVLGRVTSGFGLRNISVGGNRFHGGIDIAAPLGTPVTASRDGRVVKSGWVGAYGYTVFLDHGDGSQTRYAHLSRLAVAEGETVIQGDVVGAVGSTGASTGPHLHFEIRLAGRAIDPLPYLGR